ncbi:hypothetical protein [Thiothrix unzii]|jgi:hypothetical protein|uniref:hypothetical protein n=1 Tax=Thiothrix unzii TaxID=111769 RepID=UPI002A369E81|nr:hypothetical protein [Thiothrix unzii]MDX9987969.1 hypothetical protein [Thiothrix unzii]
MANSKFVDPPQEVRNQLEQHLSVRYKDLEEKLNESIFRSISYGSGTHPVRYTANVSYHHGQSSSVALFSYKENKEKRGFYWYCTNDWKD